MHIVSFNYLFYLCKYYNWLSSRVEEKTTSNDDVGGEACSCVKEL